MLISFFIFNFLYLLSVISGPLYPPQINTMSYVVVVKCLKMTETSRSSKFNKFHVVGRC